MNPSAPALSPPPAAHSVRSRRCARHTEREAVARCPACGGAFCRECVVEHGGRLLCASCLTREATLAAAAAKPRRTWPATLGRSAALAGGVLALWAVFYGVGSVLLEIPPNFHDGSVWQKAADHLTAPDEP